MINEMLWNIIKPVINIIMIIFYWGIKFLIIIIFFSGAPIQTLFELEFNSKSENWSIT